MSTTANSGAARSVVPAQATWYARPGLLGTRRPLRVIEHDTDHGFCSVCGAVWPCARARREQRRDGDPFGA